MGLDCVDTYSVYNPRLSDLTPESYACLEKLKRSGKIKSIGLVAYGDGLIRKAVKEGPFDIVMINYNIARQEKEPLIHGLVQLCKLVIAGQALIDGVFLKSLSHPKSKKDVWYLARTLLRKLSRVLYKKAEKYRFLNEHGDDAIKTALKYVLDNSDVSYAVFGSVM